MISIQGKGVSTGVAMGPLYYYQRAKSTIRRYEVENTEAEWNRFKAAQAKAIEQLGDLAEKARAEAGDEAAMLFETHQMMAEDLDYEEAIEGLIKESKLNAEAAVTDTAAQFADMFAQMDDTYMQARAADVKDVSGRIIGILTGVVQGGIDSPVPVVLAADDLLPPRPCSWTSPRYWPSSPRAAPAPATPPYWPARWAFPPSSAWATSSSPNTRAACASWTAPPAM